MVQPGTGAEGLAAMEPPFAVIAVPCDWWGSIPGRPRSLPSAAHCAGRELNPGYELGKLMSYHWTTGARH